MRRPTDEEITAALREHATQSEEGWYFANPGWTYGDEQARNIVKFALTVGAKPVGSVSAEMVGRLADRLAELSKRIEELERRA